MALQFGGTNFDTIFMMECSGAALLQMLRGNLCFQKNEHKKCGQLSIKLSEKADVKESKL